VCKDIGALTVAVVTRPFPFEGKVRQRNAEEGLKTLQEVVDTFIAIPNSRLLGLADKRATMLEMFKRVDDVLFYAVKGISDLIIHPGHINLDFADLTAVMKEKGLALMGTGVGTGDNRATTAAQQAISSPLLEDISIHGARAAIVNITGSEDLTLHEFDEVSSLISQQMDDEANIYLGMALDPSVGNEVRVTVIATGIGQAEVQPQKREVPMRSARNNAEGIVPEINYDYLQIPTVVRHRGPREPAVQEAPQPARRRTFLQKLTGSSKDDEDLSIPTFIRRQAD